MIDSLRARAESEDGKITFILSPTVDEANQ